MNKSPPGGPLNPLTGSQPGSIHCCRAIVHKHQNFRGSGLVDIRASDDGGGEDGLSLSDGHLLGEELDLLGPRVVAEGAALNAVARGRVPVEAERSDDRGTNLQPKKFNVSTYFKQQQGEPKGGDSSTVQSAV